SSVQGPPRSPSIHFGAVQVGSRFRGRSRSPLEVALGAREVAAMPLAASSTAAPATIRGLPRPLARVLEGYAERLNVDLVRAAYDLAVEAHAGQRRASGEEYVSHAVEVTTILASLHLDTATLVAGLVHDVLEDTAVTGSDLEKRFGREVAVLVDGVT